MTYLTFDKAIEECNDYEKFLLLGNGFSRAFDEKSFDYSSLLDSPNIPFYIKKFSYISYIRF